MIWERRDCRGGGGGGVEVDEYGISTPFKSGTKMMVEDTQRRHPEPNTQRWLPVPVSLQLQL